MSRDLIYQQIHLRSESEARLFACSHMLARKLNPDCDFLIVDNASPIPPPPLDVGRLPLYFRFPDALGHFFHSIRNGEPARDGPGRGHSVAWSIAMAAGYDRAAYIEADCLFTKPVSWAFDQMTKPVGCQPACKFYPLDFHVIFAKDLKWFKAFDWIGKYDWQNRVGEPGGEQAGEHIYCQIFGDNVEPLPIRGDRGDALGLNAGNLRTFYPDGMDIITHVTAETFAEFLRWQGHGDLVRLL